MRKLILIAALSLLAGQACAGGSRSLSLAATNPNATTEQPNAAEAGQAPTATPKANAQTATTAPTSTAPATPAQAAATPAQTPAQSTAAPVTTSNATAKPKPRKPSTEARVIRELHRHGIYW